MTSPRPLRADARRNRERVLVAAKEAFETEGISVPLDEIARRAGVGAGTVHRHFPTKEALLETIVVGNLEQLAEQARARTTDDDAGAAFFDFFALMVERGAANRALTGTLARAGADVNAIAEKPSHDLLRGIEALLSRAQAAGSVRRDVTARQVKALLVGVFAGSDWLGGGERDRRHLVEMICDGLRPQHPG